MHYDYIIRKNPDRNQFAAMRIKLLGLGHEMAGDDEIGLVLIRSWQEQHGAKYSKVGVEVEFLDSPGVNLLGALAGLDAAVLAAAVSSGASLGWVHQFREPGLGEILRNSGRGSVRGALETLSLGRQLVPEDLPEELTLIGIEGAAFTLGEGLSPAVRAAIPEAIQVINQVLDKWLAGEGPSRTKR